MKKINLAILGADGNMGQHISRLAFEDSDFVITHAYTISDSPNLGKNLGQLVGAGKIGATITDVTNFETDCKENASSKTPIDIIIDFTVAKATEKNAIIAATNKIPIVVGSTGMAEDFYAQMVQIIKEKQTKAVISSNMATGVNIFFKIAQELTKSLSEWDIEIIEAHHHRKRDAPSGTAMTVAQKIAEVLEKNLSDIGKFGRNKGPNPRKVGSEEIGIHAIRAGDIVGDHTVLYAGPGERIELIHRAHSRECFASGSLLAAKFLIESREKGKIFDMQDVLNI